MEQLRGFSDGDQIFLSQGWGDVILAFEHKKGNTDRLVDIFDIQNTLYEDFMVDRTELILSPTCLRVAAKRPDKFEVITQVRARKGRELSHANAELVNAIVGKFATLSRTPGRTDFTLVFTDPSLFRKMQPRPISTLFSMFGDQLGKIDDVVTTIGYRHKKRSSRLSDVARPRRRRWTGW